MKIITGALYQNSKNPAPSTATSVISLIFRILQDFRILECYNWQTCALTQLTDDTRITIFRFSIWLQTNLTIDRRRSRTDWNTLPQINAAPVKLAAGDRRRRKKSNIYWNRTDGWQVFTITAFQIVDLRRVERRWPRGIAVGLAVPLRTKVRDRVALFVVLSRRISSTGSPQLKIKAIDCFAGLTLPEI
jgi:hypothetical protein